jgi:hypothetical protein
MTDINLGDLITTLEENSKYLSEREIGRLSRITGKEAVSAMISNSTGSEIFDDLLIEVNSQLAYLKNLRQRVIDRENAPVRELKDLMQTTSALFKMLTQMNKDITNQDRLRKIEMATVEAVKTLNVDAQQAFFDELERRLAEVQDV